MPEPEPVDCCGQRADPRVARRFDGQYATWSEDDGFPDMVDVSGRLLDALRDAPLSAPTVLEIGCGTGAVSVALLEMGAREVVGVDLSAASVALARRRAEAAGFGDKATFEVGHGSAVRGRRYDWVVADRVICCDGNLDAMLETILDTAGSRVALSVPESRGWRGLLNRPTWAAESVWDLVTGGCRGYVHDVRAIERRLAAAGFSRTSASHVRLWHVGIYDRAGQP